jgi:hypothetical protein
VRPLKGTFDESSWETQFARLVAYKAVHGDCNVPHLEGWAEDPRLGSWVSRQWVYPFTV